MTDLDHHPWNAVVVGAGVAGGSIAALLAQRGWRVLLVEKSNWPRETVCGGCLSAASVQMLETIGLSRVLASAIQTDRVLWQQGSRQFEHAIPRGAMILRNDLDAAVVQQAINRGVRFQSRCSAEMLPANPEDSFRTLRLRMVDQTISVRAGLVIAADGLGGTLLKHEAWADWTISPSALMGIATTIQTDWPEIESGRIHMCLSKWGYVGFARADEKSVHVAAAVKPANCKAFGGPPAIIAKILSTCGRSIPPELPLSKMLGTGKLTRYRRQLGGHRVLTLGDACGYVEPVTGEGMAWAIRGAMEMNQLLADPGEIWSDDLPARWRQRHWKTIGQRQRWCRSLRNTVRHPWSTALALRLASVFPQTARSIAQMVCSPTKKDLSHDPSGNTPGPKNAHFNHADDPGDRHCQPAGGTANAGA